MKKILIGCIIGNILYSFVEFRDLITPAFILVLILLCILDLGGNEKILKLLGIVTALVGTILTIFNFGTFAIVLSGIAIVAKIVSDEMEISNQAKYEKKMGNINFKKIEEVESKVKNERNSIKNTINNTEFNSDLIKKNIVNKYDIDIQKESLINFSKNYTLNALETEKILNHNLNVAENADLIARSIGLDDEGKYLAYSIGLLHDIGKFDQIGTDDDIKTHAEAGANLLKSGVIRQFVTENKYDDIIFNVVRNHDKFNLEKKNITEDEYLYCGIIRDANTIDMFKRLADVENSKFLEVSKDLIMSKEILDEINKKKKIDYSFVKNKLDEVIYNLSCVYDINHRYSYKILLNQNYLVKYIMNLNVTDVDKLFLKRLADGINEYIRNKSK